LNLSDRLASKRSVRPPRVCRNRKKLTNSRANLTGGFVDLADGIAREEAMAFRKKHANIDRELALKGALACLNLNDLGEVTLDDPAKCSAGSRKAIDAQDLRQSELDGI
jgi:hypothetical protein